MPRGLNSRFVPKLGNRCFCWFPSAMLVAIQVGTSIVAFRHFFFCSKKPKKMKSKRFRFHFSKDTNKKTCWTCWLLFQSSLGLGEVCAWIKNGAILTIEDTDTCTVEPHFKDTRLLWTVFFVPGESPYIFFQFNLLNTDTRWSGQYALLSCPIMNTFSYIVNLR